MTQETLNFLLSLTVAPAAIIGMLRLKRIEHSYYPFVIYLIASLANELLVGLALDPSKRDARTLDWQLFNLFESIILFVQFYYWKVFERYKKLFTTIFILMVAGWVLENFILSGIYKFNPIYLIAYSFVLVLLSVQTINHIIVHQNSNPLHRNAMFIICVALVIYFIYNIFVFTLLAKGISSKTLMNQVFDIRVYVNAFTNLLYVVAVWLIPEKISRKNFFTRSEKSP